MVLQFSALFLILSELLGVDHIPSDRNKICYVDMK